MTEAGELAPLRGAFVVLGVTGGIAAYKAVEVCRRLVDAGAHVAPVMTGAATRFVGAATFSALASEPVCTELFSPTDPIPHTRLGRSADLVIVCPATARSIGEYAAGISSGLLVATLLATDAPVVVCPAMHTEMWRHPAVSENGATPAAERASRSSSPRPVVSPAAMSARGVSPTPEDHRAARSRGPRTPSRPCGAERGGIRRWHS